MLSISLNGCINHKGHEEWESRDKEVNFGIEKDRLIE